MGIRWWSIKFCLHSFFVGVGKSFVCLHLATPLSGPSGYQKLVPAQSGQVRFASSLRASWLPCSSSTAIPVARFLSTFQSLRRRYSARKAGTFETVVRPAAMRNSTTRTSASSRHLASSVAIGHLPVNSFVICRKTSNNPAKASSSSFLSSLVLKEVLGMTEVALFSSTLPNPTQFLGWV